jgi:hypothetical protein
MFGQLKIKINDYLFVFKIFNSEITDLSLCYIHVVQNDSTNNKFLSLELKYVLILSNNLISNFDNSQQYRELRFSNFDNSFKILFQKKIRKLTILACKCIIIITRYIIKANLSTGIPHFTTAFLNRLQHY